MEEENNSNSTVGGHFNGLEIPNDLLSKWLKNSVDVTKDNMTQEPKKLVLTQPTFIFGDTMTKGDFTNIEIVHRPNYEEMKKADDEINRLMSTNVTQFSFMLKSSSGRQYIFGEKEDK